MEDQLELFASYSAAEIAAHLEDTLHDSDDEIQTLLAFHKDMQGFKSDSFAQLQVVGVGVLHEVFIWHVSDGSCLIVGWADEDRIVIGVLPPDTKFIPVPFADGKMHTLH